MRVVRKEVDSGAETSQYDFLVSSAMAPKDEFAAYYEKFAPMIYAKAVRLLGNREDATEIVQEVAMKIHRDLKFFREINHQAAWIYRVTTNLCLNIIRSRNIRKTDNGIDLDGISHHLNIEDQIVDADQIRAILRCVPAKYHQIFVFHFVDGMTQEEIAEVVGVSRITVARAMKTIRDSIEHLESGSMLQPSRV